MPRTADDSWDPRTSVGDRGDGRAGGVPPITASADPLYP